jgi:hypothetical protein
LLGTKEETQAEVVHAWRRREGGGRREGGREGRRGVSNWFDK